jgi:DNA adenine methylase
VISYIGGKKKMQKWITPLIPKDIETYCEPFSGQFWIFFGMDLKQYPNLKTIVYNDFNPLNYNLYKCIGNHQRLLEECEKLTVQQKGDDVTDPICETQFNEFQSEIFGTGLTINYPDYEIAAKYVYVLTQVFSGANPEKSKFIDLKGKYHSKFTSFKNKLRNQEWQTMFESITHVENMDFQLVINKYDSPKTYFYTDPPYYIVGEGNYYSNHEFGRKDHERLAETLKGIQGKFGLSYYDFSLLHEWFPTENYRWERKNFTKAAAAKKNTKQILSEELFILNY